MARPRLVPLALLVLMWLAPAFAATCQRSVTTVATGYGPAGVSPDLQQTEAVIQALANAIGQVRGVFVEQQAQLTDVYQTALRDETFSVVSTTDFTETIRTRTSGLVVAYEVARSSLHGDLLEVEVRVTVCTDPRLLVDWAGPPQLRTAFEDALRQVLQPTGWTVLTTNSVTHLDVAAASLETGASHVVTASMRSADGGRWEGMDSVDVTLTLNLYDVIGNELLQGGSYTTSAIGRSSGEATASAVDQLGREVAGYVVRALAADGAAQSVLHVTFRNVRRPNTPVELKTELERVPGVVTVEMAGMEEDSVRFRVHGAISACALSAEVSLTRRLLLREGECSDFAAVIDVLRE